MVTKTKIMTRETFEQILKERNILWNDLVELEVFNPNYVKTLFGKHPKTIKFQGALGYHLGDSNLDLCVDDGPLKTKTIYFDFEQVLNIRRLTDKEIKELI
jgi:hypothetical protein